MEESEKRRNRLKAMRMEAAEGLTHSEPGISGFPSHGLNNPLIETARPPIQHPSRRFDFYTDPMSAFHGTTAPSNLYPPVHYRTPPRSPYQCMNPTPSYHYPGPGLPGRGMIQVPRPPSGQTYIGGSSEAANSWNGQPEIPRFARARSPGSFNYVRPPNLPQESNIMRPSFVQRTSPPNPGTGQNHNTASYYGSGRGRGRGSCNLASAKQRPEMFYKKSMIEDPWKYLIPIIWKGPLPQPENSWLPESISSKKAKVTSETSKVTVSQGSLAQYLAEAFHDSADDKQTT